MARSNHGEGRGAAAVAPRSVTAPGRRHGAETRRPGRNRLCGRKLLSRRRGDRLTVTGPARRARAARRRRRRAARMAPASSRRARRGAAPRAAGRLRARLTRASRRGAPRRGSGRIRRRIRRRSLIRRLKRNRRERCFRRLPSFRRRTLSVFIEVISRRVAQILTRNNRRHRR